MRARSRKLFYLFLIIGTVVIAPWTSASLAAQEPYVGGALVGNIARFSGTIDLMDGESFGGAVRAGTGLGSRWGVDLEFVWPAAIEHDQTPGILASSDAFWTTLGNSSIRFPVDLPFTLPILQTGTSSRHSTLTTMAWVRQGLGERVSLFYLGGIAFTRIEQKSSLSFDNLPIGSLIPDFVRDVTSVSYNAGPAVGMDARVRMTDHLALVPGMRLMAVSDNSLTGWIIRPSIGVHWIF